MRRFAFALKLLITATLLVFLLGKLEWERLAAMVRDSDPGTIAAGMVLLAVQPAVGALRWKIILDRLGQYLAIESILRWSYIGVFVNQVLPATVGGDGVRIWLARRSGASLQGAINSVIVDRIGMVLSLLLILVVSAPWYGVSMSAQHLWGVVGLVLLGTVALVTMVLLTRRTPAGSKKWRVLNLFSRLSADVHLFLSKPKVGGAVLLLSLLSVANLMLAVCLFAIGFGAKASAVSIFLVLAPVIAASTLPISIGGWGTRELAAVGVLSILGIGPDVAVLASIWLGVASILTSLPGAFFLLYRDRALGALSRDDQVMNSGRG